MLGYFGLPNRTDGMDVKLDIISAKELAVDVTRIPREESRLVSVPDTVETLLRFSFPAWQLRGRIPTLRQGNQVLQAIEADHHWLSELCISWPGEFPYEEQAFTFQTTQPITLPSATLEIYNDLAPNTTWTVATMDRAIVYYTDKMAEAQKVISSTHADLFRSVKPLFDLTKKIVAWKLDSTVVKELLP